MQSINSKEHEVARRALWAEALLIGSTKYDPLYTSYSSPYHIEFADKVLEAYDNKFPKPEENNHGTISES